MGTSVVHPGFSSILTVGVLGGLRGVLRLGLLHGAEVVDEDEGVLVLGVQISLRTRVSGAEVALDIEKWWLAAA